MDPSICLGFYCRNRKDYLDLQTALSDPKATTPKVVSFVDKVPNYMSTSVNDITLDDLDIDDGFDDPEPNELSDEEEYVLL